MQLKQKQQQQVNLIWPWLI